MSDSPRHRLDPGQDHPPVTYTGPIPVRSIDFDAVAPMRHPAPYARPSEVREPTGEGPAQAAENALGTSDSLYLAHS